MSLPFSFKINNIRILSYINDIISFASIVVYKSGNSITSHDTKKLKEIRLNVFSYLVTLTVAFQTN